MKEYEDNLINIKFRGSEDIEQFYVVYVSINTQVNKFTLSVMNIDGSYSLLYSDNILVSGFASKQDELIFKLKHNL